MLKYEHFIFDLYGTLVDIRTDEDSPALWEGMAEHYRARNADYRPMELQDAYRRLVAEAEGVSLRRDAHEGHPEIRIEKVFQKLYREKGVDADLAQAVRTGWYFRELSTEYIRLYDGAKELLESLRGQGGKVWLLSNAQSIFTSRELDSLDITGCFDGIYLSSDYGVKKPDRRFFDILLQERGIRPDRAIMTGNDAVCDIQGGRKAGLAAFYIHSNISPDGPLPPADYVLDHMDLAAAQKILLQA